MNTQNPQTNLYEPSDAQIRCIGALCRVNNLDEAEYRPENKRDASRIIDELKALPGSGRDPKPKRQTFGWSRDDRIQAFALATRIMVEKTRAQNIPVQLDSNFWAAVRSTYRDYEKQLRQALSDETTEAAA